ncbi:DGQHR domain-containing protein [Larkinella sp. VNQ87]|uniref:DGQHR domain-containing protein n=1 Tax=Larkinella sp. VNQ87 TaxID=3400921 RepID=UPI003C058D98
MENQTEIRPNIIRAKRVVQNQQEFLISVVSVDGLLRYTKYTERMIYGFDENNLPIYNDQVQRKPDPAKVNSIVNFLLSDPYAMFPTNIVLALPSFVIEDFKEDEDGGVEIILSDKVEKELNKNGDVFITIIDGQHRLRGIEASKEKLLNDLNHQDIFFKEKDRIQLQEKLEALRRFQVAVTFFIDPVIQYQAAIFASINRTQTKVSESLVYSLFGLTDTESPQKTALEVALALNSFKKSPFYGKIKLVGYKYQRGETPVLTQATLVKSIIRCISPSDRIAERERFLKRSDLLSGVIPELCFRKYYATNRDTDITQIMYAFFKAVEETFQTTNGEVLWNNDKIDNILNTTVGYETMLNLLKRLIIRIPDDERRFNVEIYREFLSPIKYFPFTDVDRYRKTSGTKKILLIDILAALNMPV